MRLLPLDAHVDSPIRFPSTSYAVAQRYSLALRWSPRSKPPDVGIRQSIASLILDPGSDGHPIRPPSQSTRGCEGDGLRSFIVVKPRSKNWILPQAHRPNRVTTSSFRLLRAARKGERESA